MIVAVGIVLWATPVVIAGVVLGRSHVFVDQGLFFSGTAVVTFGGALSAALTGITAAVVGVIANLSIFFAMHTLFASSRAREWGPIHIEHPVWSTLGWRPVVVAGLAFVLAFRYQLSVIRLLGICAVVGAALHLAGD